MSEELAPKEVEIITDEQLEDVAGGAPNNNQINTVNCSSALSSVVAI